MSIKLRCPFCGRGLRARAEFAGRRCECPCCGRLLHVPEHAEELVTAELVEAASPVGTAEGKPASKPAWDTTEGSKPSVAECLTFDIHEYLEPPSGPPKAWTAQTPNSLRRMFEALLDPRSIQWMLTLGGGLCVLGLIVWLTSIGIFGNDLYLAIALGIGSLAILGGGWCVTLKTRYRIAGQALTFLGCVVAPLNLWFYAHTGLLAVGDHLWVGGLVCCLLYIATLYVLRDPLFVYAVQSGVTLTLALLLAAFGLAGDTTWLAMMLMALGLVSIHAERAFPPEGEHFTRRRFGLPFFWSGQAQIAASLLILLGTQLVGWLAGSQAPQRLLNIDWAGNGLTQEPLLAAALWMAGVYAYLYSDLAVRRAGVYTCLAALCVVMAEGTVAVAWLGSDGWVALLAVLAVTSLVINLTRASLPEVGERVHRVLPYLATVLGLLPILIGLLLHIFATSEQVSRFGWSYETRWTFVAVMLLVACCNRVSAHVYRHTASWSAGYFFGSAGAVLLAAAGLLRVLGWTQWTDQAPLLMLIPLGYLIASRLWRGRPAEQPLGWVAHAAVGVILFHVLLAALEMGGRALRPEGRSIENLVLGLVFAQAAVFYTLAAVWRRRSTNVYFAALAACGAVWQVMGYYAVSEAYHTMLFAVLGAALLAAARTLGLQQLEVYEATSGRKILATRGRGLPAFQMGNAILLVAVLAAVLQSLNRLAGRFASQAASEAHWSELWALGLTMLAALLAAGLVPAGGWRRLYLTSAVALAGVTFLTLNVLLDLGPWQKVEIFCVVAGALLIGAGYVGRFRETSDQTDELVTLGLWLGSALATLPLLIAVFYYRWNLLYRYDELALLLVAVLLLVTGYSWQIKSTTLFGGVALTLYLILVVVSLGWEQQLATGVYLAVGGALLFGLGVALSIYREQLLELPDRIAKRDGIFRTLNWR